MDFHRIGRRFLFAFYLLGQTSLNPSASPSRVKKIWHYLPSIVFLLLTLCEAGKLIYNFAALPLTLPAIIFNVFATGKIVLGFFIVTCGPYFNTGIIEMWNEFCQFESLAQNGLQMKWRFEKFERKLTRHALLILALALSRVFSGMAGTELVLDAGQFVFTLHLILISRFSLLHVLVYVHLFEHSISFVNEHLAKVTREGGIFSLTKKTQHHQIETLKQLHYKLWQIACGINSNFGWILIALIVQTTNGSLQPTYFIVAIFVEHDNFLQRIVGKHRPAAVHSCNKFCWLNVYSANIIQNNIFFFFRSLMINKLVVI